MPVYAYVEAMSSSSSSAKPPAPPMVAPWHQQSDPYNPSDSSQFFDNRCLPLRTVALRGCTSAQGWRYAKLLTLPSVYICFQCHMLLQAPLPWPKLPRRKHQDCSKATGTGGSTLLSSMDWGGTKRLARVLARSNDTAQSYHNHMWYMYHYGNDPHFGDF